MEGFQGTMEGGLRWSQTSWISGRAGGVIVSSSAQLSRWKQKAEVVSIPEYNPGIQWMNVILLLCHISVSEESLRSDGVGSR